MADRTGIEWCDSTWNPWIGCTRVSPACDHCYAAVSTPARTLGIAWGAGQPRRRTSAANWKLPMRWNARAGGFGQCDVCGWRGDRNPRWAVCPTCKNDLMKPARRRIFCASLADVFDNEVDPQWRDDLFELISATPNLDWLLLTKRIGNAGNMLPVPFDFDRHYPNVWLGATVCNQAEANRDIPKLLALEASVRFLSIEPLLGPLSFEGMFASSDVRDGTNILEELDWVIVGGESGPKARPMHPEWVRSLRDQCEATGTPFLFKQWGEFASVSEVEGAGRHHQFCDGATVRRVGKKLAGRLLDGKLHAEFPGAARG